MSESDLHESEKAVLANSSLHQMGLVSPTQIQVDPCQSAFYTLRFLKSKFQQEAGKPSQEGRAGSAQGLPGIWQRSTVRTTGTRPTGENTEKAGGVDGVCKSKGRGTSAPVLQ